VTAIRFGLRCQFLDAPIRFRTATHRYVWSLTPARRRTYLRETAADNAAALSAAAPTPPRGWLRRRMTMDVEAREKERAVVRLMASLKRRKRSA
jgi:hypothetical protein